MKNVTLLITSIVVIILLGISLKYGSCKITEQVANTKQVKYLVKYEVNGNERTQTVYFYEGAEWSLSENQDRISNSYGFSPAGKLKLFKEFKFWCNSQVKDTIISLNVNRMISLTH